jgi:Ca2+-binding RTX toxin-like protein
MPAAQYTLNVASVASDSDAALQNILNILNPTIGAMSPQALAEFQAQLEALAPLGTGEVTLEDVVVDPNSNAAAPLFDIKALGSPNQVLQAGAGSDTLLGGDNDTIYGSTAATGGASIQGASGDVIWGGAGSDTLNAGAGYETINAGSGPETITGSSQSTGHALIYGGDGNEEIKAGVGSDTIYGGTGEETISGGSGADVLYGGSGDDVIKGGSGPSTIYAGSGAETITGGSGPTVIYGGAGDDKIYGGSGASTIYAGPGHDSVYGSNSAVTTFVVDAADFSNGSFTGGGGAGHSILELSDLTQSDVTLIKNGSGVVTGVEFGGSTITVKNITQIQFSDGSHIP